MNAYDVQQVLIANLNALDGLPLNQSTLYSYKTNLLNSVKDIAESGATIRLDPLSETQSMQLQYNGLVLLQIFYAMLLHWVPKITTIFEDVVTAISKDDLINNEGYPLNLGQVILYIKDGNLTISML